MVCESHDDPNGGDDGLGVLPFEKFHGQSEEVFVDDLVLSQNLLEYSEGLVLECNETHLINNRIILIDEEDLEVLHDGSDRVDSVQSVGESLHL